MRHRLVVGLLWLAITVAGVLLAPSVSGRLTSSDHLNGPAVTANNAIARQYGGVVRNPGVLTIDRPAGPPITSKSARLELGQVDAALAAAVPGLRVVSFASTGNPSLVGAGGRSTVLLVYPPSPDADVDAAAIDRLTKAAQAAMPDATVHGTSLTALADGAAPSAGQSSVLAEIVVGALAALVVLAWVFGTFLALLPLIMALISVLTMQLLIYGLTYLLPASSPLHPAVQFIVALLGLGLSIDYSLLVVNRWREERAAGRPNNDAVRAAMRHAGHAVWFSGVTASLGLLGLILVPSSLVRGIGIAGLFIPSTATLVALTLLPAVLSKFGPAVDRPRRFTAARPSRFWTAWSHLVIRHRVAAAVLGLGILAGLAGTAATIKIAEPTSTALASTGPYADGLYALQRAGFPTGTLTAVPIWVPNGDAAAVASTLDRVSSVHAAIAPADPSWRGHSTALVIAVPQHEIGSSAAGTSLADIRHTVPPGVLVGGEAAVGVDRVGSIYGTFPALFAVVALVTFVLLARGLKSILLPLKAVLLNALSVAASYGILVLVFQRGFGMHLLWGTNAYGVVDKLAPVLIFGFLFGVSMDYEVFILSRIREAYDAGGSTDRAIVEGVSRTGRLVTNAALILFFALASLSTANDITVRQIAAGLAAGVLLDAVVVRMLLLPALVSLFGRWNWWMPKFGRTPSVWPPGTANDQRVPVRIGDA